MSDNRDAKLYARRAGIARIKAAPTVTVLVPAAQVYPGQRPPNPPYPFIAWGTGETVPFVASCLNGSQIAVRVHVYGETTGEGDDTVPGEDLVDSICRVLVALFGGDDGVEMELAGTGCPWPATAHVQWAGTQVIPDRADGSAWHGIVSLVITVSS